MTKEIGHDGTPVAAVARRRPSGLRPPWPKGVSGNPKGRQNAGMSVREWENNLASKRKAALQKVLDAPADDPEIPNSKRIAAQNLLSAMSNPQRFVKDKEGVPHPSGLDPEVGRRHDALIEFTDGKAMQRIEVSHRLEQTPDECRQEIAAILGRNPNLLNDHPELRSEYLLPAAAAAAEHD